jgi:hypothetical protein
VFSFFREEILGVEVYGKLPLAKDYLRVGCAEGTPALWRKWLDAGFSGGSGGTFPALCGPLRFATGSVWGEPLVGLLWPSSDAGGLRKFPLTFVVERRAKPARADAAAGFPVARALWRELEALKRASEARPDGAAFLGAVRGRELDLQALAPAQAERFDFGSFEAAYAALDGGLVGLLRKLAELRRSGPRTVLRLPLAANLDLVEQAHGWLSLCSELGLLHGVDSPAAYFPADAPADGAPAALVLATRPFQPSDVGWLAPVGANRLGPEDLAQPVRLEAPIVRESSLPLATTLAACWQAKLGR